MQARGLADSAPDSLAEFLHSVRERLSNRRAGFTLILLANSRGPVRFRVELGPFAPASQPVAQPFKVGHVCRQISVEVLPNGPLLVILISHRVTVPDLCSPPTTHARIVTEVVDTGGHSLLL
jgi:hypothetical protein